MLEKCEERVRLLKAGISAKTIEKLYVEEKNLQIIHTPPVIELVEIDISRDEPRTGHKASAKCA